MVNLKIKIPTDTWVKATWEEYIQLVENPEYEKANCYYFNGELRIEMSALGNDHSLDHAIIIVGVNLFAILKNIPLNARDNCTYRKTGVQDCQPDVSYYIGKNAQAVGRGKFIINLDDYPPPDLAIEIASTSLLDDLGKKRLLYEDLNVKEYWIVDVENVRIIAFAIADGGSRRITSSGVLPGLQMSVLEEALQLSRSQDQSQVGAWLMARFQQ
jgi:Uma2 family endonuclease